MITLIMILTLAGCADGCGSDSDDGAETASEDAGSDDWSSEEDAGSDEDEIDDGSDEDEIDDGPVEGSGAAAFGRPGVRQPAQELDDTGDEGVTEEAESPAATPSVIGQAFPAGSTSPIVAAGQEGDWSTVFELANQESDLWAGEWAYYALALLSPAEVSDEVLEYVDDHINDAYFEVPVNSQEEQLLFFVEFRKFLHQGDDDALVIVFMIDESWLELMMGSMEVTEEMSDFVGQVGVILDDYR